MLRNNYISGQCQSRDPFSKEILMPYPNYFFLNAISL